MPVIVPGSTPPSPLTTGDAAVDAVVLVHPQRSEIMLDAGKSNWLVSGARHLATWYTFALGRVNNPDVRLTADDIRRDLLPRLQPGDIILSGNDGAISHVQVYIGDGEQIHSMATAQTKRSPVQRVFDLLWSPVAALLRKLGNQPERSGVIREPVADFFGRFHREGYVVLRAPNMTAQAHARGLAHINQFVGRPYDFDFMPGNARFYCTEIVGEYLRSALGDAAPRIGASPVLKLPIVKRAAVVDPTDVLMSPDLKLVTCTANTCKRYPLRLGDGGVA